MGGDARKTISGRLIGRGDIDGMMGGRGGGPKKKTMTDVTYPKGKQYGSSGLTFFGHVVVRGGDD